MTFRQMKAKPFRSLLTVLSIAFGVALYTSIDVVNYSTLKSFENGIEAITGKAQLTLMGGQSGFDESYLEKVEQVPGVKSAIPLLETQVFYVSPEDHNTETLVVLGVDLLRESSVRAYATTNDKVIDDPLTFLNQPDSLILTTTFAEKHHLGLNEKIRLATASGSKWFTIRGLLKPEGPAKAYGGNLGIMDIDGAREQFGKKGKVDRIDIVPDPKFPIQTVRASLERTFKPLLQVESPESQAESLKGLVEGYQALLSFVGVLALIVGLFLVINTTNIAIAERRKEFGILRAIGATRASLFKLLAEEAFALGLVGSACGVLLGKLVASQMVGLITRALSAQYLIPVYISKLDLTGAHWAKGVGLGTGMTVLAALIAGLHTLRIEPVEAARGMISRTKAPPFLSSAIGLFLLAFIVIDSKWGLSQATPSLRMLNPLCLIFGSILVSPFLVRILITVVRAILPMPSIRLSSDNLLKNASRTGSNIMTLMVGLMLVIVLSILNGSIKYSLTSWFDRTLAADLVVSSSGKLMTFQVQPLHEELKAQINKIPGVDIENGIGATGIRYVKQNFGGKTLAIKAFDRPHPRLYKTQFDITDGNVDQALTEFFESMEPTILVSQNFVMHFKKHRGDTLELTTPSGLVQFKIVGVMAEFTNPEGVFYLNREIYKKYWKDDLITGFYVMAKPGVSPVSIRDELDHTIGSKLGLMATLNSELAVQARQIVDDSFTYTKAIEWSALLVGLFGLFNTLMVSVLERTRELGILRAIGMTRSELSRMILCESLLQGALGGIVAISIGVFVTYFWIMGTLSSLMGWVLQFSLPWDALFRTALWGIAVGVLAGFFPSRRAAKIEICEALEQG